MSRDASGNYTLPLPAVVTGDPITATWGNTTTNDIASALTDSLSRSGDGGMTSALEIVDGARLTPGVAFANETSSGFYRAAAGDVRLSVTNTDVVRWTTAEGPEYWDGAGWRNFLTEDASGDWQFGSGDLVTTGNLTATGTTVTTGPNIVMTTDAANEGNIYTTATDRRLRLAGGNAYNNGANLTLDSNGTITFRDDTTLGLVWDGSTQWDFQANDITTTGDIACGLIDSTGFRDTCTAERASLGNAGLSLGAAGTDYGIRHPQSDRQLYLSGGASVANGSGIYLYGPSHATLANRVQFEVNGSVFTEWTGSAWDFKDKNITTTGSLTCGTFTSTGIDDNATGEILQIGDSETTVQAKLGINNTAPATHSDFADDLVIGNTTGNHGATILAATTGFSSLHFADVASSAVGKGQVVYDHTNDDLYFVVNGAEELRNDSSLSIWDFKSNALKFGTYTGSVLSIAGYVEIIDSGGTTRKLAVVA